MSTKNIIILIVSLTIAFFLGYYFQKYFSKEESIVIDDKEIVYLEQKSDSIQEVIDTVYILINLNRQYYNETYNTIIHNTVSDDYIFFKEYLRKNESRFCINNFR